MAQGTENLRNPVKLEADVQEGGRLEVTVPFSPGAHVVVFVIEERAERFCDLIGTEAWGEMNRRRMELIRRKNREGLSGEDQREYEGLQALSYAALQERFPAPPLDEQRLLILKARSAGKAEPEQP
jgi:hypothetical protein